MSNSLKVGVIGTGRLGTIHTRIYTEIPHVRLIGICDTDIHRAAAVAGQFHTQTFPDHKTLIANADLVSIATPTNSHFDIARYALLQHKHVLIEKPITNDLKQAKTLIRLAQKHRVILQVGHV